MLIVVALAPVQPRSALHNLEVTYIGGGERVRRRLVLLQFSGSH